MELTSKNLWKTAQDRLNAARSRNWSDTRKTEAAWEELKEIESQLVQRATTMDELIDKLRYIVSVSVPQSVWDLPDARRPWKQRMLISVFADLERLMKKFKQDQAQMRRTQMLVKALRPTEHLNNELKHCQIRLEEVEAERDAARSALERFNLNL